MDSWPPAITTAQRDELATLANTYALAHGLNYLPINSDTTRPQAAIHAPISLFPSPFPRKLFYNTQKIQGIYGVLYSRVALDTEFLDRVMGAESGIGLVDYFTRQLWQAWSSARKEGIAQPLHLGIYRSDYMLHAPGSLQEISLKQVEFNTISSSFGALSDQVSALHKYLLASTSYYETSPILKEANLPPCRATSIVVGGLAAAHRAYGVDSARVLFVVQDGERNVFDQRWLEYELLEKHSIKVIRQTLDQLLLSSELDPKSNTLIVTSPESQQRVEVSTVYFRAGYTPTDYPTDSHYTLRATLERSRAIKCPTLALQLSGGKKIQEVLTHPGVLESFLTDPKRGPEVFTEQDLRELRETWMGMWGLDAEPNEQSGNKTGVERAYERHEKLVLKPQREGGGNNVYKSSIPTFLDNLTGEENKAWIAMELIEPPQGVGNYLVRSGVGAVKADVVSELGVFGWSLFKEGEKEGELTRGEGGYLLRTKGRESDEGGVAVGFSVLDSLVLVD